MAAPFIYALHYNEFRTVSGNIGARNANFVTRAETLVGLQGSTLIVTEGALRGDQAMLASVMERAKASRMIIYVLQEQ